MNSTKTKSDPELKKELEKDVEIATEQSIREQVAKLNLDEKILILMIIRELKEAGYTDYVNSRLAEEEQSRPDGFKAGFAVGCAMAKKKK